jgi:4'-phosphopantetheinyl transferase
MDVYWLEQQETDVPEGNDWLGARELLRQKAIPFLKRRSEWRLGRWTAKCALAAYQKLPLNPDLLAEIEICAEPSGAPQVFAWGVPAPVSISISHRSGLAVCALADGRVSLGCDLELIEPHSEAFIGDYFTCDEQDLIAHARPEDHAWVVALLWSAKESALKALQEGLRLDTRSVIVRVEGAREVNLWMPLQVDSIDGHSFPGWWREVSGTIQTLVADPPPSRPIHLHNSIARLNQSSVLSHEPDPVF